MKNLLSLFVIAFAIILSSCNQNTEVEKCCKKSGKVLPGKYYNSNFEHAKGNYNGITYASNGKVYYVLCSGHLDIGAQIYCYDPATDMIEHLGDQTEICGEKDMKAIPQGKCHNILFEYKNKLYFGTHTDHYSEDNGKIEIAGTPPEGYKPYPGGHLLSFDLSTSEFEDLGIIPSKEGVLALTMDTTKGILYGISWPRGNVFAYNVETKEMRNLGPRYGLGESVSGKGRQGLNRAPVVSYADHKVYFNDSIGGIFTYDYDADIFEKFEVTGYDTKRRTWRQAVWSKNDNAIYANLYSSNILLRIDPLTGQRDSVSQMVSDSAIITGKYYASGLGLQFDKEGNTLYYVAVAPGEKKDLYVRSNQKMKVHKKHHHEDYNLISYNIISGERVDLGTIILQEGTKPIHINCLAVGDNGYLYGMAFLNLEEKKTTTDLLRFSL